MIGPTKRRMRELRETAMAVAILQRIEEVRIHAVRDNCVACAAKVLQSSIYWASQLPTEKLMDSAWIHDHVEMPGARKALRRLDEERAAAGPPSDDPMDPRNWAP